LVELAWDNTEKTNILTEVTFKHADSIYRTVTECSVRSVVHGIEQTVRRKVKKPFTELFFVENTEEKTHRLLEFRDDPNEGCIQCTIFDQTLLPFVEQEVRGYNTITIGRKIEVTVATSSEINAMRALA
jgi:hypothetical protein